MNHSLLVTLLATAAVAGQAQETLPGFALIPGGSFAMGDHHGFVDPKHGGDETPIHTVRVDAFHMGIDDVTTREFCAFLNAAAEARQIEVRQDGVHLTGGKDLLCETRAMSPYSRIAWSGGIFTVLDRKEEHPIVCIRWAGAAAYCNWLSVRQQLPTCYDTATWDCNFNISGFRLPTEAEWEYAARGGQQDPYWNFPWADGADATKANWPESANPFRTGPEPWTTPVGFFDGKLRRKADDHWPGAQETFQTANGTNAFGLHDMAGNVWQFINDWYGRDYYAYSPTDNPPGPASGSTMPDGKAYRGMRGGNWYNGLNGHSRVSNRNPSYFRGPQDPDHPYYHLSFRVVLPVAAENRPMTRPTPVPHIAGTGGGHGGGRPDRDGQRPGNQQRPGDDRPARDGQGGGGERMADPPAVRSGGAAVSGFTLRCPEVADGGMLPKDYTGDGSGVSLPLEWDGAPAGTTSYALIMHHIPPQGEAKWYWVLYDLPATTRSLVKNVQGVGSVGSNSVNHQGGYAPPRSKGPGRKEYILTLYALSSPPRPEVPAAQVSREVLLAAMKDRILASTELHVAYTRPDSAISQGDGRRPEPPAPREGTGNGAQGSPSAAGTGRDQRPALQDGPGGEGRERSTRNGGNEGTPAGGSAREGGGGRNGDGGEGGGRAAMPENTTPTSPNPGQTVGVFINKPQAFNGYTLFAPKHNTVIFLMDNQGRFVHQWTSAYEPGQSVHLKPNGNLLHCCFTRNKGFTSGGEGGRVEEFDWAGNLVWEFEYSSDEHLSHHDIAPLPNGNILMLAVEKKSREQCLAVGFTEAMLRDRQLFPDSVIEVKPTYPKGGTIVWEWRVWDHLIQDTDRAKPGYGDIAAHPELIDVGCNARGAPAFWNHMNSIAYNADLDQIAMSARGCNEMWVIDHSTTTREAAGHSGGRHGKGGDLIYRWGNPAAYQRGTLRDKQLVQQHDAQWIPDGSPGAGHITIFNNGYDRGWSSVEEIVPPLGADGRYLLAAGKAYGPEKPFWHYEAPNRTDFFSAEISGAHRLPNGNTLICAGVIGTLFEITATGETVWQYVNPMVHGGVLAQGERPGKDVRGHLWNAVFKVHRYAPEYPGLAGRDLTPRGVIELPASEKGRTGLDRADAPAEDRERAQAKDGGQRGGGGGSGGNRNGRPPRDGGGGGGKHDDQPPRE